MTVTTASTTTTASPTSKEIAQTTSTTSAVVVAASKKETKSNRRNHGEHQSPNNDCKDDDDDDDDDGGAVAVKVDEDVVGVVKEDDWGLSLDFHLFAQHQQYKVYSYNSFFDSSRCDKQDQDQGNCNDDKDNDNDNDTETLTTTTTASQQCSITPASISAEAVTVAAHPFQQSSSYFWIECVKDLTPLDMMQLSSGVHDATCNCVWTGAYLFLAALSLSQWVLSTTTTSKPSSPSGRFVSLFSQCIENQTILELGSGTGLAGLGCLLFTSSLAPVTTSTSTKTRTTDEAVTTTTGTPNGQTRVCFTDADPAALRLCHRNCQLNQISQNTYQICSHTWGTGLHLNNQQLTEEEEHDKQQREAIPDTKHTNIEISTTHQDESFASFDTVIATDILYDIAMLGPIFQSARQALLYGHNADTTTTTSASSATFAVEEDDGKTGHDADDNKNNYQSGRFILSHVPRACYTSQNPPPLSSSKQPCNQTNNGEDRKNHRRNALDERIIQEAVQDHGFELEGQLYPLDLLEDVTMMMATVTSKVVAAATTTTWASRTCFPTDALNQTSLEEMEELGASLFIFRLRSNTTTTASTGAPSVS